MQRRDFMKQVGAYPLAMNAQTAAQRRTEPATRTEGERQIVDLSGTWQLRMDPRNQGFARRWFNAEPVPSESPLLSIEVPSVWQQYVDADGGIGWYFKT